MKKNNRKLFAIIGGILLLLVLVVLYIIRLNGNKNELSLSEKRWIEDNKKSMIDIYVMNNLPIFSASENDIFLSFLDYFEAETGLSLNRVSYSLSSDTPTSDYLFKIIKETDDLGRNDLLFYNDNFVIVSKSNKKIQDISKLTDYKIGIVTANLASVSEYLAYGNNLTFSNYENDVQLLNAFDSDEINYIIIPKNRYLKEIVSNNYYIVNSLSSLSNKYVLSLSDNNNKLNSIFTKLYNKWYKNNFNKLYVKCMNDFYFKTKEIEDRSITAFKGKKYIYGYVENIPYEISNNKGMNLEFLNGFEKFAGVEFQLKKYNSVKALKEAFDAGKVDIIFNYYGFDSSSSNETISVYDSSYVILTHINNNVTIDSWASLSGKEIYALKDTALTDYMNNNTKATIKTYSKIKNLLKNKEPLVLLDLNTYNYYKNTKLREYYIVYEGKIDLSYGFLIKRDSTNNTFSDALQFYLTNINHTEFRNRGMSSVMSGNVLDNIPLFYYVILAGVIVIGIAIVRRNKEKIDKLNEEKSRFIDPLTSLKNRNYLNSHLDKWDSNKVYPQSIIVIDLNGLKDINNEHGYQDGDLVIQAAANILINNQLKNTDIMRTDGNEFMIYMVGYDEDHVVLYMRKLYKLMKELPHEKGATLGYSMILNDVKLVEDAINDAIVDIKNNKNSKDKND
ncbi:MAG: GGDEF domain-containing protein [Bacilli bacterium]|nr:GGDEF domain-containing protein [Bacilli bacterium]